MGYARLGILGTKYLTESSDYPEALAEFKIESEIPDVADRIRINEIIFKELVNGLFPETSRLYFNEVAEKLKARGCDAVVDEFFLEFLNDYKKRCETFFEDIDPAN